MPDICRQAEVRGIEVQGTKKGAITAPFYFAQRIPAHCRSMIRYAGRQLALHQ
jgi:hypothetical protein